MHLNKKNDRYVITAAATLFTLAIMTASIMATSPAAATTTTTTSPEAGIELSPQPVYQRTDKGYRRDSNKSDTLTNNLLWKRDT
jgi:hypothetical protein